MSDNQHPALEKTARKLCRLAFHSYKGPNYTDWNDEQAVSIINHELYYMELVALLRKWAKLPCGNPQPGKGSKAIDVWAAVNMPDRDFDEHETLLDCGECLECQTHELLSKIEGGGHE